MTGEQEQVKEVTIFTDGGCEPNPGPGGYGVILIYGNTQKELTGGFSSQQIIGWNCLQP